MGDNLGLNHVLGFNTSFNSFSFCRICKRNKTETQSDVFEDVDFLRNKNNYTIDLSLNDSSKTGIKKIQFLMK